MSPYEQVLSRYKPRYRKEVKPSKLPLPFLFRARCKYCLGYPEFYLFLLDSLLIDDFKFARDERYTTIKTMTPREPYFFDPVSETFLRSCSFTPPTSISMIPWRSYKNADLLECSITDGLSCKCGKTAWLFKGLALAHIENRRTRTNSPLPIRIAKYQ
jgi:hypothetical protein